MKIFYLLSLIILCSCSQVNTNSSVKTINIETCLNDSGSKVPLSQYASTIEYVVLQSDSSCYLDRIDDPDRRIQFHDSLIFIADKSQLFLFKNNGAFLRKIGEKGKGPGQYGDIRSFTILSKSHHVVIFSATMRTLLLYDFKGNYLKKISVLHQPLEVLTLGNDLLTRNPKGFRVFADYYTFTHIDDNGEIAGRFLFHQNEKELEKQGTEIGLSAFGFNYYTHRDTVYYWESIYDTIWRILPSHEVTPEYYIDCGSKKLPVKYITHKYAILDEEIDQYVRLSSFITTRNLYFFNIDNLTHLTRILYDHSTGACLVIKYSDSFSRYPIFKLYNDIDGGMNYWPIGRLDDHTTFSLINGYELKERNQEKMSKSLREIAAKSTQLDNPIIMMVNHGKH